MYRNVSINVIFIRNVYYIHLKIRKSKMLFTSFEQIFYIFFAKLLQY